MRFYDRDKELNILDTNWNQTTERGRLTVVTGRRRIGKTTMLRKSAEEGNQPFLYLYVSKDNERVLTGKFQEAAEQALGLQIFGRLETFAQFFEQLMRYGQQNHFTLIFDEFQNFIKVNPAIPSHIQDIWDKNHEKVKVNMVACGSIYMLTGGVAKYVAWLMDAKAVTKAKMLRWVTQAGSPYLSEGTELIMSEFGKDYTNYLSILQLIASGLTTQSEIDRAIGKNTGAYLDNLEVEYSYIHHRQPMFSKPGGRNSRWQLDDCFLRFWFRFILRNQALVEMERNDLLLEIVERGYEQYSGLVFEQYFRQKWMEEERVTLVGNYWDRKGVNEIDMIAINEIDKKAVVAEVKRQRKKLNSSELAGKVSTISKKLAKYEVRQIGLTMEDM